MRLETGVGELMPVVQCYFSYLGILLFSAEEVPDFLKA
jgi:hypothetical protein